MLLLRNFLLRSSQSSLQRCKFSVGFAEKKKKKNGKKDSLSPELHSRIKQWPNLLQAEIDASGNLIKSMLEDAKGDWTDIEQRGLAIGSLKLLEEYVCPINGRILVFSKSGKSYEFSKFRTGTPVLLCSGGNVNPIIDGIFLQKTNNIKVKVKKQYSSLERKSTFSLLPSNNTGAVHSLRDLLRDDFLRKTDNIHLLQYAFRSIPMPSIHNDRQPHNISEGLDNSQRRAVSAALNKKRPFVCIRGPPGTGKTRVIAEIVRLLIEKGNKVLVCAPTHVAVNNAMNKTLDNYHPKINPETGETEEIVEYGENVDQAVQSHEKYQDLLELGNAMNEGAKDGDNRTSKSLEKKARNLKNKILQEVYKKRLAIFSTISSSTIQRLESFKWSPDVIIIDEAGQCSEPSTWAAIVKARRCILVGDDMQLPPLIFSEKGLSEKLNVSLLERLALEFSGVNIVHQLNTQYRMNEKIMKWSSNQFYDSLLTAAPSVASINITNVSDIPDGHPFSNSLIMVNTDNYGSQFNESRRFTSYYNNGEADLVVKYINFLLDNNVTDESIGVITPYFSQAQKITQHLKTNNNITVSTVDAFQGKEKEVILFSMVRNNQQGSLGFLRDYRRLNVAVTRARRQFVLFGSVRMLKSDNTLKSLFRTIKEFGVIYDPSFMNKYLR